MALNNLPDISQNVKLVNLQELYNVLLEMQQRLQELEVRILELETKVNSL